MDQRIEDIGFSRYDINDVLVRLSILTMLAHLACPLELKIAAASPDLYVSNLTDAIFDHCAITMPPLQLNEAHAIADIIGVDKAVVDEKWRHRKGITRYLFEPGAAKRSVDEDLRGINPESGWNSQRS